MWEGLLSVFDSMIFFQNAHSGHPGMIRDVPGMDRAPRHSSQPAEMRAHDVLNALERVTLFRAQAADSHRRVEDIGDDLDSAIALLELRQSREEAVVGTTADVTRGAHRAVLDWSTGVIAKLAAALPKPTAPTAAAAASPGGGDSVGERHARNARRWLSDPRIWRAFVRSLRGGATAAAEPSTHLPQAASLGVLRAAVFAVRAEAGGEGVGGTSVGRSVTESTGDDSGGLVDGGGEEAAARDWAFVAILTLCGGVVVTAAAGGGGGAGEGARHAGGYSSGSLTSINSGVLDELLPRWAEAGTDASPARKWGMGGALMRMSLDTYVTFLEEVIRGHVVASKVGGGGSRGRVVSPAAVAVAAAVGAPTSLEEGALTELLRFQVVLQAQQTSRRTVFATFCSKLMGPLFQVLARQPAVSMAAASPTPLEVAAKTLVCEALFHEENLEGYREAFTAAEKSAAAAATTSGGAGGVETGSNPASSEGGSKKKRRRKNKGADGGEVADGGRGGSGGGKAPRRVCYQQQLLDEIAILATGSKVERERWSRLGAMAGAPLLLEGFITRLGRAAQHHEAGDIHDGAGTGAAVSTAGVKRSRSSGTGGGGGGSAGGVSSALSPASQMFRLWALLTSTLSGSLKDATSASASAAELAFPLLLLPCLRSGNSMLRLLADHDVYRINEDWGGLEFDQLRSFSAGLIRLASADTAGTSSCREDDTAATGMLVSRDGSGTAEDAPDATAAIAASSLGQEGGEGKSTGAAQEFLRAFGSLLGLNHNILHDDLRPVLRMTFDWAATAEAGTAAAGVPASRNSAGDGGVPGLRALAIGLVVSLVDTYGRLRQMDHLVRALFGAIADRPSAAAAMLRRDECTAALGRAFRRLPEGQIESLWAVFAVHLREGWSRGGGSGGELLAKEVDAELFVLFVRNLHVTSSVASGVGRLCTGLAEESLRSFGTPLQQAAAAAAAVGGSSPPPSSSKKAKKKKKRKSGEHGEPEHKGGDGGVLTSEMMLSFRPALDVHGWLLDLDTRCRFWYAVLESPTSSSPVAMAAEAAATRPQHDDGDVLVEENDEGGPAGGETVLGLSSSPVVFSFSSAEDGTASTAPLPRVIAAAAAALEASRRGGGGGGGGEGVEGVRRRLEKTLQQVAVHRVQQIYAHLNGIAALKAAEESPTATAASSEEAEGEREAGKEAEAGDNDDHLEEEARGLVEFACKSCGDGWGQVGGPVRWGDEDLDGGGGNGGGGNGGGASWSMMMPYLPVWVGFAAKTQVALFLEALLSRCASDVLAGRGEEESSPLKLLSDASFYEMEAVAKSAPTVILARVYRAVKHASSASGGGDGGVTAGDSSTASTDSVGVTSSLDEIVTAIQTLAKQHTEAEESAGDTKRGAKGREHRQQEQGLLEAACLVMITKRFPPGFLDDEAIAGLLVAADALDAVLTSHLSYLGGGSSSRGGTELGDRDAAALAPAATNGACLPAVGHRAALVEAVTALRGLALRLGRALPPDSPLLDRLSHGDALLRVVGPVGGLRVRERSLLRASSRLLPFLTERCVTNGDTKTALKAVVGLGLIPRVVGNSSKAAEDAGEKRRQRRGHPPLASSSSSSFPQKGKEGVGEGEESEENSRRLLLLHGVLSGFVAGESRRLAKDAADAAAAAATTTTAMELDSDSDYDDVGLGGAAEDDVGVTQRAQSRPSAAVDQRLVATVSHLVGCLPAPSASGQPTAEASTAVLPSLLLVWSDALRLSFLGADAQRLVFADRKPGGAVRSRSRWVEDCIVYLAERAESGSATAGGVARRRSGGTAASMPSQRSASCHLIRAVCGCSHLLDPPLARRSVRRLAEAFVAITGGVAGGDVAEEGDTGSGGGGGGGDFFDVHGAAQRRQRADEDLLLHTAFCLLVQHSSEVQLDEIVTTLLEILGAERGAALMSAPSSSPRSLADHPMAVTFMRLATRAGRGAAFKAVVPRHALSLATALCRQLREVANRGGDGGNRPRKTAPSSGRGGEGRGRSDRSRLRNATGALEALEGLLDRQPYSSITARGVSVILGSVEPAVRAALDALVGVTDGSRCRRGSSSTSEASSVVGESLLCFCACCRVLGTVLQHYARKVYSCTPPFASLCRSLLRLLFRLASAPALATIGAEAGAPSAPSLEPAGTTSSRFALSAEQQVAAASVFARVLEQFVPHKEVLKKYAPFLLLEYVSLSGLTALEPAPKAALLSGIFAVMQACSRREMRQLHGLLGSLPSGTGQEVFRSLNEDYQREHKYMGKM